MGVHLAVIRCSGPSQSSAKAFFAGFCFGRRPIHCAPSATAVDLQHPPRLTPVSRTSPKMRLPVALHHLAVPIASARPGLLARRARLGFSAYRWSSSAAGMSEWLLSALSLVLFFSSSLARMCFERCGRRKSFCPKYSQFPSSASLEL